MTKREETFTMRPAINGGPYKWLSYVIEPFGELAAVAHGRTSQEAENRAALIAQSLTQDKGQRYVGPHGGIGDGD